MQDEVIGRIGRCIYCKTTSSPLQREHIVPYGLDGPWVLEGASCETCADITSKIEDYVLRTHLMRVRAGLQIRTRRKKKRPNIFPILVNMEGHDIEKPLSIEDQPVLLVLPLYGWPECMIDIPPTKGVVAGGIRFIGGDVIQVSGVPMEDFRNDLKAERIPAATIKGRFDPDIFARFIAKIAYGFAVAKFGLENIEHACTCAPRHPGRVKRYWALGRMQSRTTSFK